MIICGLAISLVITTIMFLAFKPKNKVFKTKDPEPEPIYYTISFDSDGGTTISDIQVLENTKITLPKEPTKQGYIFANWYDEEDEAISEETIVTKDMVLKAKWIEKEVPIYTVTFDTRGGNYIAPVKVAGNDVLKLPKTPVRDGYTFVTWVDENDEVIKDFMPSRDTTIYAEWKETYICPAGFKKDGKKCIKTMDSIANYSCSEGELYGTVCLLDTVEFIIETTCPGGYELDDDVCIATEGIELGEEEEECEDGYILKSGVCYQETQTQEIPTCPEDTLSLNNTCYNTSKADVEYSCEKTGYEVDEDDNDVCKKIVDAELN